MALRKCCVNNCNSTNNTHRLFNLPKNDTLRTKWLSFLLPVSALLSGLTKQQLVNKHVCHIHFDRHQFDGTGNRLQHGYPCLFTEKEILNGMPMGKNGNPKDHSYSLATTSDDERASEEARRSVSPVEGRRLVSPVEARRSVSPVDGRRLVSPVEGMRSVSPVEGRRSVSPVEGRRLVSPVEARRSVSPVDERRLVSPVEGMRSVSPVEEGRLVSPVEGKSSVSPVEGWRSVSPVEVQRDDVVHESSPSPIRTVLHDEQQMEIDLTEATVELQFVDGKHVLKKIKPSPKEVQNLRAKKCFITQIKELANSESKKGRTFVERYNSAKELSQNRVFIRNISKLNKLAINYLYMRLKFAVKKRNTVRFTTQQKLLSLTLKKESPKGYALLQNIFTLPTERTLNCLADEIFFNPGLNENIFLLLRRKVHKWDNKKRLCSIIVDEVALTPDPTFDKRKERVKGFKDLGNVREAQLCNHGLVFMVRGVCSNWRQPIAYYFCEERITPSELVIILKELVAKISFTGLIPLVFICNQDSTFTTAINILKMETEQQRILNNEYYDGSIQVASNLLNVIFDPPHLLRGIRNNFLTKNMIFNGKLASWDDILTVYNIDCQLGDMRVNKKLTDQHVISHKIKKTKVSLAAELLSQQTSALLKYTSMFEKLKSGVSISQTMGTTADAVGFFDKLFDSVNGSRLGSMTRKLRGAVKRKSEHFSFWQDAKEILKNVQFVNHNSKRPITAKKHFHDCVPTLEGWVETIESFKRISNLLFNEHGVQYFYPRNLNGDPIEKFFERIRAQNYRKGNTDCIKFINAFKSLLISNIMSPYSIYSNCEDEEGETVVDFFKLMKYEIIHEGKENSGPLCARCLSGSQATMH